MENHSVRGFAFRKEIERRKKGKNPHQSSRRTSIEEFPE
jgi:hypothetical protein